VEELRHAIIKLTGASGDRTGQAAAFATCPLVTFGTNVKTALQ